VHIAWREDKERCEVWMYHTPHLRGLYKRFVPARWNETIGNSSTILITVFKGKRLKIAEVLRSVFRIRNDLNKDPVPAI